MGKEVEKGVEAEKERGQREREKKPAKNSWRERGRGEGERGQRELAGGRPQTFLFIARQAYLAVAW